MIKGLRFLATTFLIGQSYAEFISVDEFRKITLQRPAKAIYDLYHMPMSTEEQANGISTVDTGKYFRVFESFVQTIMDDGDRYDKEMLSGLIAYKLGGTAYETIYRMALLGYRFEKLPVKNYYPNYGGAYQATRENHFGKEFDVKSEEHEEPFIPNNDENLSKKSSELHNGSIHEDESGYENNELKHQIQSTFGQSSNPTEGRKNRFVDSEKAAEVKAAEKLPEDLAEKIDELSKKEKPVLAVHLKEEEVLDKSVIDDAKNAQAKDIKDLLEKPEFIQKTENTKNIDSFIGVLDYPKVVELVNGDLSNLLMRKKLEGSFVKHFIDSIVVRLITLLNENSVKNIYDKIWFKNIDKLVLEQMFLKVSMIKNKDIQEQVISHKNGNLAEYAGNLKKSMSKSKSKGKLGKNKLF